MSLLHYSNYIKKVCYRTKTQLLCIASSVLFLGQCGKADESSVRVDSTELNSTSTLLAIDLKRIDLHLFDSQGFYLKDTLLITGGKFEGNYSRVKNDKGELKYRVSSIYTEPGEVMLITLSVNSSNKDEKGHNWVLLDKNLNKENLKSLRSLIKDEQFSPKLILKEYIIEISDYAKYRDKVSVNFEAPKVKGQYIYLCTYPGHYEYGEYGYLIVK
jgi:azurin